MPDQADVASAGVSGNRLRQLAKRFSTLPWVTATPLGRPVEPEVWMT